MLALTTKLSLNNIAMAASGEDSFKSIAVVFLKCKSNESFRNIASKTSAVIESLSTVKK